MTLRVHTGRRQVAIGVPVLLIAVGALAACGSSDNGSKTPSAGSSPSGDTASIFGPEKKASGEPIKLGFADDGVSAAIDTSDQGKAAQAAVNYANDRLGGIGGRPIQLVVCETKNTPAGAADCGNQFVSQKVLAVNSGSLGQTDPVVKAINAGGIPLVDAANTSPSVIQSTNNFSLTNPLNPFGGPAELAKQKGIKRVAIVVIDVPAAIEPAKQISPLLFGNAGVAEDVVGIAPGVADASPQIQAEEAKKPGAYHIIGNPQFCGTVLKAIRTLGITSPVTTIDRCLDATSAAAVPGGYNGLTAFTTANIDPANADTKLYQAVLKTYGNNLPSTGNTVVAYQSELGLIRALNAASLTDFTSAGLTAALRSAPATPLPLGGGSTFQCNGKAVAIAPAVCAAGGITATSDKDGKLSDFKTFEASEIYKAPGQ